MDAMLKRLHSPDVYNLENYQPEDSENFCFLLQAMVGPSEEDGEESFDIEVCTPKWIEENYGMDKIFLGQYHLIVREYNYQRIVNFIEQFLKGCSGKNWSEISMKVSRLGLWEFEEYQDRRT